MKREEKSQIIDSIIQDLAEYKHVYVTDMSDLTVETSNALRRLCFNKNVKLKVVKNTLLKRAMDASETDFSELYPVLEGSTSIMLSNINNAPAKVIKDFRGKKQKPLIKGAFVEENVYIGDNQIDALISIKTREELIGDIVGLLQSPARNVISALQSSGNKIAGLVKTLSER
ncbi:MAG: 50S ribosomal protein L10 [Bacteroidota bacterium]